MNGSAPSDLKCSTAALMISAIFATPRLPAVIATVLAGLSPSGRDSAARARRPPSRESARRAASAIETTGGRGKCEDIATWRTNWLGEGYQKYKPAVHRVSERFLFRIPCVAKIESTSRSSEGHRMRYLFGTSVFAVLVLSALALVAQTKAPKTDKRASSRRSSPRTIHFLPTRSKKGSSASGRLIWAKPQSPRPARGNALVASGTANSAPKPAAAPAGRGLVAVDFGGDDRGHDQIA